MKGFSDYNALIFLYQILTQSVVLLILEKVNFEKKIRRRQQTWKITGMQKVTYIDIILADLHLSADQHVATATAT